MNCVSSLTLFVLKSVDDPLHQQPSAQVEQRPHPSPVPLILAVVVAVVMGLQCFIPVIICVVPGLVLALKVHF